MPPKLKQLWADMVDAFFGPIDTAIEEKANLAEWLESRLHYHLTTLADDMFGDGRLTRDERIALSGAVGDALDVFHAQMQERAPQLFDRARWDEPMEAESAPMMESADVPLTESAVDVDFVPLVEKAVRRDGTVPLKLIQPGWGSSGYYAKEVLERDGPQVFRKGTKMYWDHPTAHEEAERPERSLRDYAATLTSDARWMEQGPDGPGLYADASVLEAYRGTVDEIADHIGVSIRAMGRAKHGEAEGRKGAIVEAITSAKSVDFVTEPGAGGRILQLFEAARPQPQTTAEPGGKDNDMELEERIKELEAENARLKEAQIAAEAKTIVSAALAEADVPVITKARLAETLAANPPTVDGALDRAKLAESVKDAVKAEIAYLQEAAGYNPGKITGMGSASITGTDTVSLDEVRKRQDAAFAAMGYGQRNGK